MLKKKIVLLLVISLLVSGCSVFRGFKRKSPPRPKAEKTQVLQVRDRNIQPQKPKQTKKHNETGVVFGRISTKGLTGTNGLADKNKTTFSLRNIKTNEIKTFTTGKYFIITLPPGEYEFYSKSTNTKTPLIPLEDGFKFTVEENSIKYIGSLLTALDTLPSEPTAQRNYGFAVFQKIGLFSKNEIVGVRRPAYYFYIVNESLKVVSHFRDNYKSYHKDKISIDLMH